MSVSVVGAVMAIRMRRYKEAFRAAGAVTPARAMRPADVGMRESLVFHKLVRQGVLVAAGDKRFYLDEARDAVVMQAKRKIITVLLFIILILLIGGAIAAWRN